MHSENQNDQHWKMRLEDTASLAGEALHDKNAAWEKLYSNLHKKKSRRVIVWRRIAAACLITAIISIILLLNKKEEQPSLTDVASPTKNQAPSIDDPNPIHQKKNSDYTSLQKESTKNTNAITVKKNTLDKKNNSPIKTMNIVVTPINQPEINGTVIAPALPFDSAVKNTTVVAPVKKKLKVVHINELGQPAEEATVTNKFNERLGFEFKIIRGEIYNSLNTGPANSGLILFKSRNTSSN